MNSIIEYIINPSTIISIIVFIFWLWGTWANLNSKLKELERRIEKIEDLDLDSRLTKMQVDLDWIKTTLDELKRKH